MEVFLILFLIILNGIFSMSEIALISARKSRLASQAEKGDKQAQKALSLANEPNEFLSTVQIGITLIGILTGIFSGDKITTDVQNAIASISFLKPYSQPLGTGLVVVLLTFFSLVLGELIPKRLGLNTPEKIAKNVAGPMLVISKICTPFIWLLTHSTELALKILNIRPTADGKVTEEEIRAIIKEGAEGGALQDIEQDIVERVFHVGDRKVNSLMTHRKTITYIKLTDTADEIRDKVKRTLHSSYPVVKNNLDEIVGVVSLKKIFETIDKADFSIQSIIKEPKYFIEHTTAYKALETFKVSKKYTAFIVDEYGVFQGMITMNDILEALVGDADEFVGEEFKLEQQPDGTWLVDGYYNLHDFLYNFELEEHAKDYEVTTVSGLMMEELSNIPRLGEKLIWNKLEFEVIEATGLIIKKISVKKI
nr:hemolysin family protein [uncultured Flavobacterium sp.]